MKEKNIYEDKTPKECAEIIANKMLDIVKSHLGYENRTTGKG